MTITRASPFVNASSALLFAIGVVGAPHLDGVGDRFGRAPRIRRSGRTRRPTARATVHAISDDLDAMGDRLAPCLPAFEHGRDRNASRLARLST